MEYTHLLDYVVNEDKTFSERPFCDADSMVLAQLAYIKFERLVHKPSLLSPAMPLTGLAISERMEILLKDVTHKEFMNKLMHAVCASRRFCDVKVNYAEGLFSAEEERQFAAVTFFLSDGTAYVAFRGTDNTIVGWRENFNMAYIKSVPAQKNSVEYLEKVAHLTKRGLHVGGHSKGGNLAVYAAMNCNEKVQDRILDVYSLDGPGFKEVVFERPEYLRIKDRIKKIMPEGSLIGTLLNQSTNYRVVKSDGEGFEQHSMRNWLFDKENLVFAENLSDNAIRFDRMLDGWVASLSDVQLEGVVETLFDIVDEIGAKSFDAVLDYLNSGELTAVKAYKMIEPDKRKQAAFVIAELGKAYLKSRRVPKTD